VNRATGVACFYGREVEDEGVHMKNTVALALAVLLTVFALAGAAAAVSQGSGVAARAAAAEAKPTVLLATGRNFPDALAGAVLTHAHDAPLMLTQKSSLPPTVAAEITRRGTTRVIILGGESAIGPEVVAALAALRVPVIERIGGSDRFATSAAIAGRARQALGEARDARLKEIQAVVASETADVRTELASLAARVGLLEGKTVDLDARLTSVETSLAADAGFWPEGVTISTVLSGFVPGSPPTVSGDRWFLYDYFEMGQSPALRVTASYRGQTTCTYSNLLVGGTGRPEQSITILHIDGKDYTELQGTGTPPTEGAPIDVEYWFELYGQRVHGTKRIPGGWTYAHK
jgi:hypothetical protein